jgi:hypothetical protein
VLARRRICDGEIAYYLCYGPAATKLNQVITIAAARWQIEECFQAAKGEAGLDHYQVRRYDAWSRRHITLSMLAHAYLAATAAACRNPHPDSHRDQNRAATAQRGPSASGWSEPLATQPGRMSRSGGGGNAFEDDDRECPVGVLLVCGGAVGDHAVEPFALLACGHEGPGLIGAVAEFDRHGRVGSQVVEPGRMPWGACLGGHHEHSSLVVDAKPSGTVVCRPVRAPVVVSSRIGNGGWLTTP